MKSLTFNDGTKLELGRTEIVLVVGPNNAGKSATLREAHKRIVEGAGVRARVLSTIEVEKESSVDSVKEWVLGSSEQNAEGKYKVALSGWHRVEDVVARWDRIDKRGLGFLSNTLILHLDTESRLTKTNPIDLINFVTDVPTETLHRLYDDDQLETTLAAEFKRAFKTDLIVNRGAGRQVVLHVGERPVPPPGTDRQSSEFRHAVNSLPPLHEQGDGMRAFVGVLASVLAADRDVIFVDEPEAFLHPPQAYMLGRVLSTEAPTNRQILLATHSSDVVRGILDQASPRVRIVRLRREGSLNRVTELDPTVVRRVWADPLLRYSRVLDGLFHDGVVVCEGDADCRFYEAMMQASGPDDSHPDLSFVHSAGKSRMRTIVTALRAIGVPVRVVADFDVLRDQMDLQRLFESLGGVWSAVERDWKIVKAAVDDRRAQLATEDVKEEITDILDGIRSSVFPEDKAVQIRDVLKKASAWGEAKRVGKAFLPSGDATVAYQALNKGLREKGLYVVEVGELERFCPTIAGHGPGWVTDVLARDLSNDSELQIARDFVSALIKGW